MMETIYGLTGQYSWLRKRVWFWQRKEFERDGWITSPREGRLRPMMVKRIDAQREKNHFLRRAIDAAMKS